MADEEVKRLQDKSRDLQKDLDKVWDRLRDCEQDVKHETDERHDLAWNLAEVAKLSVYTARAVQEGQAKYKLVC